MYTDDTIAAIATAPGVGGVGIVRVSGPLAARIGTMVFRRRRADEWRSHYLYRGQVVDPSGAVLDEGLAVLMRAPRSYTGEDVLEIHGHGSPVALRRILSSVLACGARLAEPGEFTKRAFLNGRLDLTQAEAVADMVRSRTDAAAALAAGHLAGRLSAVIDELRDALVRVKALLEAQIDFSEEDFRVDPSDLCVPLDQCSVTIKDLVESYGHGRLFREGLHVAIVGKPNVGKSSLLNALLGEERAIVTAHAGTTRDTIEETADFNGVPVVLTDTAGLRATEALDPAEQIGIERTQSTMQAADILLIVLDASQPIDAQDRAVLSAATHAQQIVVLNKTDLPAVLSVESLSDVMPGRAALRVSAKDGQGLDDLRRLVVTAATDNRLANTHGPVLTNVRHVDALQKAAASLHLARASISAGQAPDLIAVDVQDAMDHLAAVTGVITSEDVLDRVFSEFCIGK